MRRAGLLLAAAALLCVDAHAERCRAADGDSLRCGAERVRLYDVYAAELNQAGGRAAKRNLDTLVRDQDVTLKRYGTDRYGRTLADAYVRGRKIVQSDVGPRAGNGVKTGAASRVPAAR